ncbi:hypothetical protein O181_053559 [Austropuccinia psidii MF-1]|uniref:Integrase catalytic domain-containing protein n=1 Tax=Austropuccinia psidii MF-1 TaxID=1389203 RepID=A0A9Q3E2W8_9BASI|nr:hypothetical protein [Austropuccinia psidii MF-1]
MKLSVASSELFKVNAIGSIALNTPYGSLKLNNVLYCGDIPGVILSLGHLLQENFSIRFLQDSFHLSNQNIHFLAIRQNNRWFVPFNNSDPKEINLRYMNPTICSTNSNVKSAQNNSLLWHKRIVHFSIRHLKRMQQFNTHCPVRAASRQIVNQPGDLMGPYECSINNKRYILMIQDAFSHVVVAIPLTDKSEAKTYFINWIKQFMNITTHRIKTMRTDNGTEFKNYTVNSFLTENGITHEYSMPYEHHQNGIIERTNQTILEMAWTCLLAVQLPEFLWPWAFRHSVWIFNCYVHVGDKLTPFELLGQKRPSLELLRVFGAK